MKKVKGLFLIFLIITLSVCLFFSVGCSCSVKNNKKELVLSSSSVEIDRYESVQLSVLDLSEDFSTKIPPARISSPLVLWRNFPR